MRSIACLALVAATLAGCGNRGPTSAELELAERMNDKAEAINARAHLAFDPSVETIVSKQSEWLVRNFRLPLAYSDRADSTPDQRFAAYRIVRFPRCYRPTDKSGGSYTLGRIGDAPDLCLLKTFEPPPPNAVRADTKYRRLLIDGVATNQYRTTVRRPDGAATTITFYRARDDLRHREAAILARALGLVERAAGDPAPPGMAAADRWILQSHTAREAFNAELVDALAATGRVPPNSGFSPSKVDPQVVASHADLLLSRWERGLGDPRTPIQVALISDVVSRLPEPDWRARTPRLLEALNRLPAVDADITEPLLIRLSDRDAAVLPVLVRAKGRLAVPEGVAIGACRIGPAAAPLLGQAFLAEWERQNRPIRKSFSGRNYSAYKRCVADGKANGPPKSVLFSPCWQKYHIVSNSVYFALKRMGLGSRADAMARHIDAAEYARRYAELGPQSPAAICSGDRSI